MRKDSCKDSYEEFIEIIAGKTLSREEFIQYGLDSIIMVEDDVALAELKKSIDVWNHKTNGKLYVRRFGKHDEKHNPYIKFYSEELKIAVRQDHDNNREPKERLKEKLVGKWVFDELKNYQFAHVWDKTKNPIMFTALFNIVLIPKMFDPFTGHEAEGVLANEFRRLFLQKIKVHFKQSIKHYNDFVSALDMAVKIDNYCKKHVRSVPKNFCTRAKKEWETIEE